MAPFLQPAEDRRGVTERWKSIPKELVADDVIPEAPHLEGPLGVEWQRLVDFRDGLVHANASRPQTTNLPEEWMPMPSKSDLDALEAGWALRTVVDRVRRLDMAVGTDPPACLAES